MLKEGRNVAKEEPPKEEGSEEPLVGEKGRGTGRGVGSCCWAEHQPTTMTTASTAVLSVYWEQGKDMLEDSKVMAIK